jgi:beta-galactosidase
MFELTLTAVLLATAPFKDPAGEGSRRIIDLNAGWRFYQGDNASASEPGFDDSEWQPIHLPHTWNARDGQDGGNDYYRGACWYRLSFPIPANADPRRYFLRFGAASLVAEVFLNGQRIGEHRGGFAAFCFEITPNVRLDQPNLLAVKVDNSQFEDVAPWSADFTMFGGLYRGLQLIVTDRTCISPLDYASSGVYAKQTRVNDERAELEVTTNLSNGPGAAAALEVLVQLFDSHDNVVARDIRAVELPPNENVQVVQPLAIDNPKLWPYLHQVRVQLRSSGTVMDEVRQPVGLRFFRVDSETGFHLNGRPHRLYGVNRHQDRLDKGWAISEQDIIEDFEIIREIGCNAVRLAHYQHSDFTYSVCDKMGLVVWAEIPLVNRVFDTPAFRANCRQQLIELIRQNYNHPSIFFWGIHNEVTAPWEPGPDASPLVRELVELARQEDPSRPTVCAGTDPRDHPANWQTDLVAFNRYFGWYGGEAEEIGDWLDKLHAAHAETPVGISEYGAGASIRHHELPPKKPEHAGDWHPEEWQAHLHEVHWRELQKRPYVWCTFIWNMFDFASDGRSEGDARGRNDKGLVAYDRRTKKDAFYFYKSQWSHGPFVRIASKRFNPRRTRETTISVYSNANAVDLFVNGNAVGAKQSANGVFEWPEIQLAVGENIIRAIAADTAGQVQDECRWTVEPPPPGDR